MIVARMTNEEALKCLDNIFNYCEEIDIHIPEEERSGYQMLPDVLKLMNYLRRAKESFEKQIQKKMIFINNKQRYGYECPSCNSFYSLLKGVDTDAKYCKNCGQKIFWGDHK